ncbi:MAG TPA: M56 and DUF3738 domain-containing protein [Terriglobia bacterium]|nr:M56 and DUF3738 domain-containing protein [Terriglobia bacterium]
MSAMMIEMNRAAAAGLAALLNTLWYAGAVVGLTWLGLRCLPRVNAATRYWIWTAVLASLLLLPFLPGLMKEARSVLEARPQTTTVVAPLAKVPAPPLDARNMAPVTLTVNNAPGSKPWPLWLLAVWMVAAGWQLERLARGLTSARRLKARAEVAPHVDVMLNPFALSQRTALSPFAVILSKAKDLSILLRVGSAKHPRISPKRNAGTLRFAQGDSPPTLPGRMARLLASAEIASPAAVGYRHPAVIVPPGLLERLEEGERRNVLLHELAHLARYDDWMALVTHALGALLVLHPLAAIVMGRIEREREMACDDFVVARTGSARSYARSLARLHDLRWSTGTRLLAPGLLGRHSSLGNRIESLLRRGREFSARPSLLSLGVSALLLAVLLGAGGLMPGWIAIAQTALPTSFEVASIKPGEPGAHNSDISWRRGGRFSTTNTTIDKLIQFAYEIRPQQIEGLPLLAKSRTYTVRAVAPPGTPELRGQQERPMIEAMLQSLLADRFKLQVHRTTKQLPVYEIVIAKHGPKLKPMAEADFVAAHHSYAPGDVSISSHDGNMTALGVSMAAFADDLSRQLDRTVIDKTGLTGRYDFTLTWTPWRGQTGISASDRPAEAGSSAQPDTSGPSIFTAVQQQLGLKLKPAKGPVEVLVIDHVEPPTPN